MQKILAIAGRKQSGKSTAAKFLHGYLMQKASKIQSFRLDGDDDLLIVLPTGQECLLDIYRQDEGFYPWATQNVWPFIKVYSFAEELKESCIRIFGVNPLNIYGADDDKNKPTHIKWQSLVKFITPEKYATITDKLDTYITHRELMQEFGTTICRGLDNDCWMRATLLKIRQEGYPFCVIDDCRFENEVDFLNANQANIVRLSRAPYQDNHSSELMHLVPAHKIFFEIDNQNLSIEQKNEQLQVLIEKIL